MNKPMNKAASAANQMIVGARSPYDRWTRAYKKASSKANRRQGKKIVEDEIICFS